MCIRDRPFILRKFRARSGLFAGAAVAAVLIYTLSLSVWNIQIEGNNRVETAEIQAVLKSLGMTEGVRRDEMCIRDRYSRLYDG